jgi:16S rRNA C1402 N4-methylase RsmH
MRLRYNLTGKNFGRLLVISFHHKDEKHRSNFWKCQSEKESEFFCKSNNKCRSCRTKMQALRRFRTPIV